MEARAREQIVRWRDLQLGDVVADRSSNETCLLLDRSVDEKGVFKFRWYVLCGISQTAWGSNPYWVDSDMVEEEIEGWDVYRASDP